MTSSSRIGGRGGWAAALCAGTLILWGTAASGRPLPDERSAPILDRLELSPDVLALGLSDDGRQAVVAVLEGSGRSARSRLDVHSLDADEPWSVSLGGLVRHLLFIDAPPRVFVVEHRPAKRHAGQTHLVSIDLATRRTRRELRLPTATRSVTYWASGASLLVPARNEIRTIALPSLRSGPLYRVLGDNLSAGVVAGTRILVGQSSGIALVDLADPQNRDELPVRERVAAPGAVVAVDVADDRRGAQAVLDDGRRLVVGLDPLTLVPGADRGPLVVPREALRRERVAKGAARTSTPSDAETPPYRPVDAQSRSPADTPPPALAPVPATPGVAPPARATDPGETAQAVTQQPARPPGAVSPPAPVPPDADASAQATDPRPRIRGRITGPGRDSVRAVVLFGPNSILREATRVAPDADGAFEFTGLAPGRYRVQPDGGGHVVVISEPASAVVELDQGEVLVQDFRVLRSR